MSAGLGLAGRVGTGRAVPVVVAHTRTDPLLLGCLAIDLPNRAGWPAGTCPVHSGDLIRRLSTSEV